MEDSDKNKTVAVVCKNTFSYPMYEGKDNYLIFFDLKLESLSASFFCVYFELTQYDNYTLCRLLIFFSIASYLQLIGMIRLIVCQ